MGKTRRKTSRLPRRRTKKALATKLHWQKYNRRRMAKKIVDEIVFEALNKVENKALENPFSGALQTKSSCLHEDQPTCSKYLTPVLCDSPPRQPMPGDEYFDRIEMESNSSSPNSYLEEEYKQIEEHSLEIERVKDTPIITGNRIVDINYFLKTVLRLQTLHNKNCTGGQLQLFSEKKNGLKSIFIVKCNICEKEIEVSNEDPNTETNKSMLNRAAVWGTLSTGSTYTHMTEFLSVLDIPSLPEKRFYSIQRELSEVWQNTLWNNMRDAGKQEKQAAIANGDVDDDGIPFITVYLDGGWSKRSYGHTYNAASGVAVIIGKATKKLLFIGVRNKYCSICARAENQNESPDNHACFKNWDGSSSAMEQDIIVEGFTQSVQMHGLKYKKFIADGDSTVNARIKEKVPYGLQVVKVECMNHTLKNYSKALYKIKKDTKGVSLAARKLLTKDVMEELVKNVQYAIYNNVNDVENLKCDIRNSVNHVFGKHYYCREHLCTHVGDSSNDITEEMRGTGLHHHIYGAMSQLLAKAHLLTDKETNNRAELYMSLLCRFNMGKRLNLIQRDSFQIRSHLTGLKYNEGHSWHRDSWKKIFKKSPGKNFKTFIQRQEGKTAYKREHPPGKKSVSKKIKFTEEKPEYGSNISEVTLEDDELKTEVENLCEKLQVTYEEKWKIFRNTVGQFNNPLFLSQRMHRLTASNFGAVIRRKRSTSCDALVKKILSSKSFSTPATEYGKENEGVALSIFVDETGLEVQPCGLMISHEYGFLGASPDGMINDKEIVEIKCSHKVAVSGKTLEEAVRDKQVLYLAIDGDNITLKKNHDYYYQVQGQLAITKADRCHFIVYTGRKNKLHTEIIERDDALWKNLMLPKLTEFFKECLAPEIILNRREKKLKCRDPPYILEAQRKLNINGT